MIHNVTFFFILYSNTALVEANICRKVLQRNLFIYYTDLQEISKKELRNKSVCVLITCKAKISTSDEVTSSLCLFMKKLPNG